VTPPAARGTGDSPGGGTGAPTRERLLAAAREVVAKDGLEGLTLRAIARHAGVSHGAPLRHFPTLAALLAAVAASGFDRLVAVIDARLVAADAAAAADGRTLPAIERLALAGDCYVDVALADPGVFSITFRPERCDVSDQTYQDAGARAFGQLVDLTVAAQAEGWHPDVPSPQLAAVLWTSVHGTAELSIHGALDGILGPDALGAVRAATARLLFGRAVAPRPVPSGHVRIDQPPAGADRLPAGTTDTDAEGVTEGET
jgi:AcrR family transcriptional regulator